MSTTSSEPKSNADWTGTVDAGGVRLHVVRAGTGPELVVIHGGPDWDHSYLRAFMKELETDAHLVFFDMRGCGRSERFANASEIDMRHVVEDVRNLIARLSLSRPALLGFGFGGRIGLEFLARYPQHIGRFILASSSAYAIGSSQKDFLPKGFPAAGGGNELRNLALDSVSEDVRRVSRREEVRDLLLKLRFSTQWLGAIRRGIRIGDPGKDYTSVAAAARIPILVVHGEFDQRYPVAAAQRLAREVPDVRLSIIREAAHFAHVDAPEAWNAAVAGFLNG
jgi:pimeloyl-ACP methyl ester carboxylesterase